MNARHLLLGIAFATASVAGCRPRDDDHKHDDGHKHKEGDKHDDHAHADEVHLTPEAIARHGVKIEAAAKHALRPTVLAPARVALNAEASAHVGSPLPGRAVEIKIKLGDRVTRGQELLIIESPELGEAQSDFLQRRAALLAAGPQAELARSVWERARLVHEQSQGLSLTEVQKRESEHKAAAAALEAARAAVDAATGRLRMLGMDDASVRSLADTGGAIPRFTVRSPIDGRVVQREVTPGELVSPDREALLTIADTSTLWVLAEIPEARALEIAVGSAAWVSPGFTEDARVRRLDARIDFIAHAVDTATRTIQARIVIPADAAEQIGLRPGMFAQAEIAATPPGGDEPHVILAVPDDAVHTIEGGPAVFVPVDGEPGAFTVRPVLVGKPVGGLVPIVSGLAEGDRYVAAGAFILKAELGKSTAAHEH